MGAQLAANGFQPGELLASSAETEAIEEAELTESAPVGPSEDEESAFLAGAAAAAGPIETDPSGKEEEAPGALPAMDTLVKRIPAEVLRTMDELFRAKFVQVQRVPKKSLKR